MASSFYSTTSGYCMTLTKRHVTEPKICSQIENHFTELTNQTQPNFEQNFTLNPISISISKSSNSNCMFVLMKKNDRANYSETLIIPKSQLISHD